MKGRTLTRCACKRNVSMMCENNLLNNCKSETGSFRFIGNKWRPDMLKLILCHPAAIITDGDTDSIVIFTETGGDPAFGMIDGLAGITDKIQ